MTRLLLGLTICAQTLSASEAAAQKQAGTTAEEESAKATGGTAAPLAPGALRDNVTLVRQNEAELGRLIKEQQP